MTHFLRSVLPAPAFGPLGQRMLGLDLFFILLALTLTFAAWVGVIDWPSRRLRLEYDHSLANIWNYLKWAVIAVLFAAVWWRGRSPVHAAAALVFLGMFLDDALELHEAANAVLSQLSGGIAPQRVGALLLIVLALGAAAVMAFAWARSTPEGRRSVVPVLVLLAVLIVAGGGLDLLQSEVSSLSWTLGVGIGLIEDGTELIIGSLLLCAAVAVARPVLGRGLAARPTGGLAAKAGMMPPAE